MKLKDLTDSLLRLRGIRAAWGPLAVGLGAFSALLGEKARLQLAEAHFLVGDYAGARRLFAGIGPGESAAKAQQMMDWIDYKSGDVSRGWPVYPSTRFVPQPQGAHGALPARAVRVVNFNQPQELVRDLRLSAWTEENADRRPILVWFNLRESIGGEIFAAKIVRAFQAKYRRDLVLVVDPRLREVVAQNFSGTPVYSKTDDIAPLGALCGSYLLARDALKLVVARETDFEAVAAEVFSIEPALLPAAPVGGDADSRTPQVAFSWKTTNRQQGIYRTIPLDLLARRLAGFDLGFHSAQHGVVPQERELLERHLGDRVRFETITPSASVLTIAAQLRAMDLVLTIDNSVLHIAGAFDVPTIGLLSVPSYWAWPLTGPSSRWYRSVKLLHQKDPGDWGPILDALAPALRELEHRRPRSA